MRNLFLIYAAAASLLLSACGSDEKSASEQTTAAEKSARTQVDGSAAKPVEEPTDTTISPEKLAYRIKAGSPPIVLDVRSSEDYALSHIPGSINIPLAELPTRLAELPSAKSAEIVIVQRAAGRNARKAAAALRAAGYSNLRELSGHWKAWQAAKLPSE